MRTLLRTFLHAHIVAMVLAMGSPSFASMDWSWVGDPGNAPDTDVVINGTSGHGRVNYGYFIGTYEVTNHQYVEFLNAVAASDTYNLYKPYMTSTALGGIIRNGTPGSYTYSVKPGLENKPVNYVNWYDAQRFANWMNNGQPVGPQGPSTTEDGAYTFSGPGTVGTRNPTALIALPGGNEWYKAAYYKGGSTNAGYWNYATRSDSAPTSQAPLGGPNSANYYNWDGVADGLNDGYAVTGSPDFSSSVNYLTDVGAYRDSYSAYGTYDQTGNVREWTEFRYENYGGNNNGYVGSSDGGWGADSLYNSNWFHNSESQPSPSIADPVVEGWMGVRLVMLPEPATLSLLALGGMAMLRRKR